MGILIRKEKDDWLIELRETWEYANTIIEKLLAYKIPFIFNGTHIVFNGSLYRSNDFNNIKEVFLMLLDMKKSHGQLPEFKYAPNYCYK